MHIDRRNILAAAFAAMPASAAALPLSTSAARTLEDLFPIPEHAIWGHWTKQRLLHMRYLCAQGLSATRIAKDIGGVTRNAVIGKLHRLNWMASRRLFLPPPRPVRVRKVAPRPSRALSSEEQAVPDRMQKLLDSLPPIPPISQ